MFSNWSAASLKKGKKKTQATEYTDQHGIIHIKFTTPFHIHKNREQS